MDDNKIFDMLVRVLEGMSELKAKMESSITMHTELKKDVEKLEGRVCRLEQAPGSNWNTLKAAIITAIGGIIGAGIALGINASIKP
jgi:hypothetical protein